MIFGSGEEGDSSSTSVDSRTRETFLRNPKEDRLSIIVPLINLMISLVLGIYMIPTLVQAAISFGL
jgi:hypothetical protein